MNQCLRCHKQCGVASLFCDECRVLVRQSIDSFTPAQPVRTKEDISHLSTSPHMAILQHDAPASSGKDDIAERTTTPNPAVRSLSPHLSQSSLYSMHTNRVEQALQRLKDAARRIAAVEPGDSHKPRFARLSPMHDVSGEIQRHNTPEPSIYGQRMPAIGPGRNHEMVGAIADPWPWLQSDPEELVPTGWSDHSDPLLSRRFPDSAEAAYIEAEDIQRVAVEGPPAFSLPLPRKRGPARIRIALVCLALIVLLGLTIDGVMASFVLQHNKRPVPSIQAGTPTLTLSSNNVTYGQDVTLHIRHFSPSSEVYVTRDMEVAIRLDASIATVGPVRSMIRVNPHGDADVSMYVDTTWDPGYHTIEAEDTQSHYTASTSLHIDNAGPTRPPYLVVDNLTIDLGAEMQGANSLRPLEMHNAGSGSITWSASSDQPWLLLAPNQGTFSDKQTISVGGERANLKPGDYKGTITVSSNAGAAITVPVIMTVRPLPTNAGPVLQVTPVVLAFVSNDGGANPPSQDLVVSNPGSRPMHWSLSNNAPSAQSQGAFLTALGSTINWLSTNQTTGTVAPGATASIQVNVQSLSLLPGAYIDTIMFTADQGTINSPQSVNISLTVQPQCSLQLSSNAVSFTTIQGQSNPNSQAVSLSATASCQATTAWNATSSQSWLMVTPASGQLKGVVSATMGVEVNTAGLSAKTYNGVITITTGRNTQVVQVQLVVQSPPAPGAPILSVSPLNFSFNVTQGQPNPPGQVFSITNTGGRPLYWRSTLTQNLFVGVALAPSSGIVAPGQTQQAVVNVRVAGGSPGPFSFTAQISGYDANNKTAGGSPQSLTIGGNIQAPCTLAPPSASSLAFAATQGGGDPAVQALSFTATGNCAWPVNWRASGGLPSWLHLSPSAGAFNANGQSATLNVAATIAGLSPGTYSAQVSIAATDGAGQSLTGSPQSFTVSLTVQAPCTLQAPSGLTFSTAQGQTPSAQTLGVSESGTCARPVGWTATSNSGWLVLSPTSGADNGGGSSVGVSIDTTGLAPGTYNGTVSLSAGGNGAVQNSPQTVPVTLTVTGFTVSGTANACADSGCSTSVPLAGATVTLTGNGPSLTTTTDTSGNYSFGNVTQGNCTISVSGNNGTSTNYTGSASINVTGNQSGVTISAVPS